MAITTLTAAPDQPSLSDQDNFDSEADAFVAWMATMAGEFNTNVDGLNAAIAAAPNAIAAANAEKWVSGTAITEGDGRWSPTDFQSYRAKNTLSSGANTTDPEADPTNWEKLSAAPEVGEKRFTYTGAASAGDPIIMNADGTVSAVTETADGTWSDAMPGVAQLHRSAQGDEHKFAFNQDSGWGLIVSDFIGSNVTNFNGTSHLKQITSFRLNSAGRPVMGGQALLPAMNINGGNLGVCPFPEAGGFLVFAQCGTSADDAGHCFHIRVNEETGGIGFGGSILFARTTGQEPDGSNFCGTYGGGQVLVTYRATTTDDFYAALFGVNADGDVEILEEDYQIAAHVGSYAMDGCYDTANDVFNVTHVTSNSSGKANLYKVTTDASSITGASALQLDATSVSANQPVMVRYDVDIDKPVAYWRNSVNAIEYRVIDNSAGTPTGTTAASYGSQTMAGTAYHSAFDVPKVGSALTGLVGASTSNYPWAWVAEQLTGDTLTVTETQFESFQTLSFACAGTDMGALIANYVKDEESDDSGTSMRIFLTHTSNLTEHNFIGFAQENAADGESKKVDTIGGICTSLTGITPGLPIYVRPDGSYGHTRKDRGVRVGRGITSTSGMITGGGPL